MEEQNLKQVLSILKEECSIFESTSLKLNTIVTNMKYPDEHISDGEKLNKPSNESLLEEFYDCLKRLREVSNKIGNDTHKLSNIVG